MMVLKLAAYSGLGLENVFNLGLRLLRLRLVLDLRVKVDDYCSDIVIDLDPDQDQGSTWYLIGQLTQYYTIPNICIVNQQWRDTDFGPLLDDRLKENLKQNILKPWKGVLCFHFRVCPSPELQSTPFDLGT